MRELRKLRVLVSGASGLIGAALVSSLKASGAQITRLTRDGSSTASSVGGEQQIPWNPERPIAPETLSGFDAVIHLAGENIVGRWTAAKKAKIRKSRVDGTRNLAEALVRASQKPQVFVCSSATGYYGDRGDEILKEESAPGQGFLPEVCQEWEQATSAAANAGIRTVQIRTGIVLSPQGGALAKVLPAFRLGVGGRVGDGRQWMSWIDIDDLVGAVHHILGTDLEGPVNMVAPRPVTNEEFTKTLARVLSRPAIFPVPAFVVRTIFGQMGREALLASQRVEPAKLVMSGYPFRFSELRSSLKNVLG